MAVRFVKSRQTCLPAGREKLKIVSVRGGAAHSARPPNPSPFDEAQDEDRIPFELFLEYTALDTAQSIDDFLRYVKKFF
ncbi:hypothetical protein HYU92_00605 [Candidatus Curtissbacteria bacterium]|nr:hypothetical protein [Candidatus Curtissbacteria bacterium]